MAQPPGNDGVSVTERGKYSGAAGGPATDTEVHTRATPNLPYTVAEPTLVRDPRLSGSDLVVADLRQHLRTPSEVSRRQWRMPSWLPMVAGASIFVLSMALGVAAVVWMTRRPPVEAPAEPDPVDEIGGIPVREGLRSP